MSAPVLEGEAAAAVAHRGSHLQIIASAGPARPRWCRSGWPSCWPTGGESGHRRLTFTDKAAAELKERITERVAERLGARAVDLLGGLFVGTIHAYCLRLLQQHVPRYETFDVLDQNQLNAFLAREAKPLELKELSGTLFKSIKSFLLGLDVVENELLDPSVLPEPFRSVHDAYLDRLERYRLLTFGQQVARAVRKLERPEVAASVHTELRHLVVDEYQDVNPAQERLIRLLTGPEVELCVVGDDDQAIYHWRGSNVANIVGFTDRYRDVRTFSILDNRRSVPAIVDAASSFARSIPGRIDKAMTPVRPAAASPDPGTVRHVRRAGAGERPHRQSAAGHAPIPITPASRSPPGIGAPGTSATSPGPLGPSSKCCSGAT